MSQEFTRKSNLEEIAEIFSRLSFPHQSQNCRKTVKTGRYLTGGTASKKFLEFSVNCLKEAGIAQRLSQSEPMLWLASHTLGDRSIELTVYADDPLKTFFVQDWAFEPGDGWTGYPLRSVTYVRFESATSHSVLEYWRNDEGVWLEFTPPENNPEYRGFYALLYGLEPVKHDYGPVVEHPLTEFERELLEGPAQ